MGKSYTITNHCKKVIRTDEYVAPVVELDKTNDYVEVQLATKLMFEEAVQEFESKCQSLSHFCCESCHMTGICIKQSQRNNQICPTCQASIKKENKKETDLPIWYDKKPMCNTTCLHS